MKEYPRVMTIPETAEFLRINRNTAYELARRADFPSFTVGRVIRVDRDRLEEWVQRQKGEVMPA